MYINIIIKKYNIFCVILSNWSKEDNVNFTLNKNAQRLVKSTRQKIMKILTAKKHN